ncbi:MULTISPECIES: hypothetical protein [unclassified Lactococcus]|uniref:hypothetical protein n=1 Tax=unclassified Lactococcus TaxID=2643510 RepID=UPI0011C72DC4|nr:MULTISPECIES: hypothetical protein [unclassified Lactococcus]MQW22004.1 hypothetical protein [Lactococcus sp. dk101]TXK36816.1 hypothetical protein FVP42_10595 [Lactococcus sp. dk310]TXK47487.1 hypothetical protein FVP43_10250 [Lactococcus sp. dk322]
MEYNLYENFNPNIYALNTYNFNGTLTQPPLPKPKARGLLIDYELWTTGYEYTSSAILTSDCEVGDIVEVLLTNDVTFASSATETIKHQQSLIYEVIDVDDDNKATLKNYFWAMIDGMSLPTALLKGNTATIFNKLVDNSTSSLVQNGVQLNASDLVQNISWNRKNDTDEAEDIAKTLFRFNKYQPITFLKDRYISSDKVGIGVYVGMVSRQWKRSAIETRIDDVQNVSVQTEVITERSNYNFVTTYVKNSSGVYSTSPTARYTLNSSNTVVNMTNYTGNGSDLPIQRISKTMFFDEAPTTAEIRAEITGDTVISKLYFNQSELLPLQVNDLVKIWYNGMSYSGHISDKCYTPFTERLLFIEGDKS